MRPLHHMPRDTARAVQVVLTDIDDTLTDDGRLGAAAYSALERLQAAGLIVVPITGRPAGWCDQIARMWPVDAVVGENGAFYFRYDREKRAMIRRFFKSEPERAADRERLAGLRDVILAQVPGAGLSADQAYREADLAIDFREDVPALPPEDVRRIKVLFEQAGAQAKISSIHVNGWFGDWDKLTMTRLLLAEAFNMDLDALASRIVFAGDSPNDAPMFAFFPHAVGVANVLDFAGELEAEPAWVTPSRGGAGFVELAELLLLARRD
ncbi:HAD-IIB family hydrolase [Desulfonatronum thiodismutans]|uniref:HAD-IIB family hydrolase n=1 Tax=Desulfonatronum thiodismutans TaxID=159290 RepID=UPI0004ABD3DC|nr:HAD-IIB family hydrolase [Desulfonatronum thiodismutans]